MENKSEIAAIREERINKVRGSELENELKGLNVSFGTGDFFSLKYDKESCEMVISDAYGWSVRYPPLSKTWTVLAAWLSDWNDESKEAITRLMQCVIYPTCMRIADIDKQYLDEMVSAHIGAAERIDGVKFDEDGNVILDDGVEYSGEYE